MKSSDHSKESFGTLPDDAETADSGLLVPHSDSDAKDLQRVRDLLFGATSKAHASRLDSVESALSARLTELEKDFQQRLQNVESQVRADFRAEVTALTARLDEHGTRKVERADLRSMLADLADRIGQ
ncbi:hypothetical protein Poly30_26140 [Planctomycetes bacterium Poly30]|uniref:Uncharacterized protein n=1 Tax=Saltatorellus ferox TaxID=2528018 RepID=A0A518ESQ7_9BACT|nr:hypothetical protein Poly30_26140 [Planctomycetes bacterium Poly30]